MSLCIVVIDCGIEHEGTISPSLQSNVQVARQIRIFCFQR